MYKPYGRMQNATGGENTRPQTGGRAHLEATVHRRVADGTSVRHIIPRSDRRRREMYGLYVIGAQSFPSRPGAVATCKLQRTLNNYDSCEAVILNLYTRPTRVHVGQIFAVWTRGGVFPG